jgi:hypothetical protein
LLPLPSKKLLCDTQDAPLGVGQAEAAMTLILVATIATLEAGLADKNEMRPLYW